MTEQIIVRAIRFEKIFPRTLLIQVIESETYVGITLLDDLKSGSVFIQKNDTIYETEIPKDVLSIIKEFLGLCAEP